MPVIVCRCLPIRCLIAWFALSTLGSAAQAQIRAMPFSMPDTVASDSSDSPTVIASDDMIPLSLLTPSATNAYEASEVPPADDVFAAAYQEPTDPPDTGTSHAWVPESR